MFEPTFDHLAIEKFLAAVDQEPACLGSVDATQALMANVIRLNFERPHSIPQGPFDPALILRMEKWARRQCSFAARRRLLRKAKELCPAIDIGPAPRRTRR
ncbi:MAG: hypothetical protein F4W95_02265 [Chloroflexi bacterium]|nr:hypothetical protein [Chloroflexota bacterium]MYD47290.1 hypothetical protein [Chloroflexota bacterium]